MVEEGERNYTDRQAEHDREYAAAWENSPLEFKQEAAMLGIHPEVPDTSSMSMDYDDSYSASSHTPDMARIIDNFVDQVVEILGARYHWTPQQCRVEEIIVRETIILVQKPLQDEVERNQANLLNRVAGFLIQEEKGNLKARVHALMHSIPRMAAENGFPSMRASARSCGVSPEWLRRKRDNCCDLFSLKRPSSGIKSEEAKLKYRANALGNHWRNQIWKRKHEKGTNNGNGSNGIH
jgi:hypothetical protein